MMEKPSALDICCGRGKGKWNSPGNRQFKQLVLEYLGEYQSAPSKTAKSKVVESVVREVQARGGRFLRRDETKGLWFEIGPAERRAKVAHCIRDHLATSKKRRTKEGADEDGLSPSFDAYPSPRHSKHARVIRQIDSSSTQAAGYASNMMPHAFNEVHGSRTTNETFLRLHASQHGEIPVISALSQGASMLVNPLCHQSLNANEFQMVSFPMSGTNTSPMINPMYCGTADRVVSVPGQQSIQISSVEAQERAARPPAFSEHMTTTIPHVAAGALEEERNQLPVSMARPNLVSSAPVFTESNLARTTRPQSVTHGLTTLASQLDPESFDFVLSLDNVHKE